ncbi:MAG: FliA/WhiG family RNA polymerase sigma factor [Planctomycetota bacterium]
MASKKKSTGKADKTAKKAAKKSSAKKAPAKAPAKKAAKKATAKKAAKKAPAKKVAAKKPAAKKATVKKPVTKAPAKTTAAKTTAAKPVAKKAPAKKAAKKTTKKGSTGDPTLDEAPTEELWTLYRKEADAVKGVGSPRLDELRNALIERHYPLVRYIAERLLQTLPKSIELDDLISAGLFGLMDAIRGFDASRGIKFKTYCSTRIRGAILDQLRSQDWVPRLVRLKATKIERALQKLTAEFGREPTHAELARNLEMEHDTLVMEIQEARAKTMFSLSEKWEDDDGSVEKVEVLEDRTAIDPVGELNRRDLMGFITRSLTHKERFIIEQYYQYGHTMREIGEMLALTESRVCQIHSNVMGRLKSLLGQRVSHLIV